MPRDSWMEADRSAAKKSKTGAMSVGSKSGEKSWGQRKASVGKSESEKPLDLRKWTVARILWTASGDRSFVLWESRRRRDLR